MAMTDYSGSLRLGEAEPSSHPRIAGIMPAMLSLLHDFAMIFVPLFVVVDPAGSVPVYLVLTNRLSEPQRRRVALRATAVAAITGVLFVILGQAVMGFLGIRFEDFQIAGGILVLVLALLDILSPGKPGVEDK